jgi:hypothetical protein
LSDVLGAESPKTQRARMGPSTDGNKNYLERVKGIEPSYEAWEAAVLPLNYTRFGL